MFNYDGLVQVARNLLANFGQPVTFLRESPGQYNIQTGSVDTISQTFTDKGVIFPYRDSVTSMADSLILKDDQQIFWQGTTAPLPNDRVTVGGKSYNVIAVQPLEPGGINVLYELQVRK